MITHRGISFEEIITAIEAGSIIDILPHPKNIKYSNQKIYFIEIKDYVYVVPFDARIDLRRLKEKAAFKGLPYQTFIASILHECSAGHFNDVVKHAA